jgi:hypothetical protein
MSKATFTKVSEWIAADHMNTGWELLEGVTKASARAVAFKAEKWNRAANLFCCEMWMPRSQLVEVTNDYYTHGDKVMFLAPSWLMEKKRQEGFDV